MYVECISKTMCIVCAEKKLVIHTEILRKYAILRIMNFKNRSFFIGSKTCPNWAKLVMEYPMCIWSVKSKIFWYSSPRKKLVLHSEICDYFHYLFFMYSIFHRVKDLSKLSQTRYGVSHVYVECKTKKNWYGLPRLEKVSFSYGNFANIRDFANNEFLK